MPECIGFNNIHMHAGIIHHSLMSCQQSVIWPIMHEAGIMDGRHWNRVHRLPCLFSLPCHARLWFSFLQLGDSSHSTFLTVTVSSVSYGQFWGARVKWELTSEIVVIFCWLCIITSCTTVVSFTSIFCLLTSGSPSDLAFFFSAALMTLGFSLITTTFQ